MRYRLHHSWSSRRSGHVLETFMNRISESSSSAPTMRSVTCPSLDGVIGVPMVRGRPTVLSAGSPLGMDSLRVALAVSSRAVGPVQAVPRFPGPSRRDHDVALEGWSVQAASPTLVPSLCRRSLALAATASACRSLAATMSDGGADAGSAPSRAAVPPAPPASDGVRGGDGTEVDDDAACRDGGRPIRDSAAATLLPPLILEVAVAVASAATARAGELSAAPPVSIWAATSCRRRVLIFSLASNFHRSSWTISAYAARSLAVASRCAASAACSRSTSGGTHAPSPRHPSAVPSVATAVAIHLSCSASTLAASRVTARFSATCTSVARPPSCSRLSTAACLPARCSESILITAEESKSSGSSSARASSSTLARFRRRDRVVGGGMLGEVLTLSMVAPSGTPQLTSRFRMREEEGSVVMSGDPIDPHHS
mmetsp:Transcript_30948/g.92939  ORF Transcript_30948/g.92939 Transcript_30948/m.92939 type:complete len:427 (-) Transcript_30948:152-1432(-)